MKVQQRRMTTTVSKNKQNSAPSTSFEDIYKLQNKTSIEVTTEPEQHQEVSADKKQFKTLDNALEELEDIMHHFESGSQDHHRAQRVIDSLRDAIQDMPQAFPLSAQDKEEAKALLTVESKRIDELQRYEA